MGNLLDYALDLLYISNKQPMLTQRYTAGQKNFNILFGPAIAVLKKLRTFDSKLAK